MKDLKPDNTNFLFYSKKPLGEILIEAGLISINEIEIALQEQKESNLRIGDILVERGYIDRKTADFFADRWEKLLCNKNKKPLAFYFQEAGLLDPGQIKILINLQKKQIPQKRFDRLAVERGYLKQNTVDFFINYLFNIHGCSIKTHTEPYKILQEYIKGETNFTNTELSRSTFKGFNLKGVKLDGANLSEADLRGCNFSYSSFVRANISRANLTKIILTEVNLELALAIETNFNEAHLEKANFSGANLQGANLRNAYLSRASFASADLVGAKLAVEYPYLVYYDRHTRFDRDFDPEARGWEMKENRE